MIDGKNLFIPELKTKFKVLDVHYEPHCESIWYLQLGDVKFYAEERGFYTTNEDKLLVGSEIEAAIDINTYDDSIYPVDKKEKSITILNGSFIAIGIYMDDIIDEEYPNYDDIAVDSIFKFQVSKPEIKGLKIGDWVKVVGFAVIELPR